MAKAEDQWGFLGLEAGEGIFRNTDIPTHVMTPGKDTFAEMDFNDLLDLQDLLDDDAFEGAKYYFRRSVFNAMRKKVGTDNHYIFQAPGQGMPPTFWNIPVELGRILPSTTDEDQADTMFGGLYNLQHLLMGVSRGYELEMSKEATVTSSDGATNLNLWERDMVAIRVMESIDFAVSEPTKAFASIVTSANAS